MNNYDVKCRIIEEELKTFWPQWHVIRRLGGGAFGDVFEIYRENFGIREKSALKMNQISDSAETVALLPPVGEVLSTTQDGQTAIPEAFRNEIQIMEALRGAPNIVTIEDFHLKRDASSTMLFVRMELLTSFQQMMVERQKDQLPFIIPEVLKIGRDICNALMYCEEKGIIHRDIKPANLFKDSFGNYKVGDFGVSRCMDTVHAAIPMTGIGTISYMAPEVFKGQSYNNTVDIYALGLILYQLLNCGRIPFLPATGSYNTRDVDSANYKRLHGEPLPSLAGTRIGNDTVDASLDSMIRKACAIRSEDRYQNSKTFYEDLVAWGIQQGKKSQEYISQGHQQEKETQVISQQRLPSLSKGQSQDKNLSEDRTTPFPFVGNTQYECMDTSIDIHQHPQTEMKQGLDTPGTGDLHNSVVKGKEKISESWKKDRRIRISKYAFVFALMGTFVWMGCLLIRGIQLSHPSSFPSTPFASNDEVIATASPASIDVEKKDSVDDDMESTGKVEEFVEIPDPVLKRAIQDALGIGDREITVTEALSLTRFEYDGEYTYDEMEDIAGEDATWTYLQKDQIEDFTGLSAFKNLTALDLQNYKLSNISALSSLKSLKELKLSGSRLSNISALSSLTNLTKLELVTERISNINALSDLENLRELKLTSYSLRDISALSCLTNLTKLYLDLEGSEVSDIYALSGLTNLSELFLYLDGTGVSDISALSGLTNLTKLDLSDNQISDINALSGLTNLIELDLSYNQVSDISALSGLTNLRTLTLTGNPVLKNKSIEEILSILSGAKNLTIIQ